MNTIYLLKDIEKLAQDYWTENKSFALNNNSKLKKYYCLSMFPYPSGKLHMGHIRNYTIGDIISRYKRMFGYSVFNPIGWDAFGMPAENAARDNNISPNYWTKKNIYIMKNQLKALGFGFDWDREINTSLPKYYKWEQMFFLKLYESGIVYRKNAFINWDPVDNTVLANEQVIDGKGWRSNAFIERRKIPQWYISITKYADMLIDDLDSLDNWPNKVKEMQKNWIYRKHGVKIHFEIKKTNTSFCFFLENFFNIDKIIFIKTSEEDEIFDLCKKKNLYKKINGIYYTTLINKLTNTELFLFFSENLEICMSIFNILSETKINSDNIQYNDYDKITVVFEKNNFIDSKFKIKRLFYKLNIKDKKSIIFRVLKKKKYISILDWYNLKDWCISRQRIWGVPIPIIYCKKCGIISEKISNLPIRLPNMNGKKYINMSLSKNKKFINCFCNKCGKSAIRESDTFDTFFESSWYYAKYICDKTNLIKKKLNYWLPVDQYIGGIEHANLHLIYARFFCKVMKDFDVLDKVEPFKNLLTQGMILMNGSKMSKSKGNIIDQEYLVNKYGADTLRLFIMFIAPPEQSFEWNENGIIGCKKFLDKIFLFSKNISIYNDILKYDLNEISLNSNQKKIINEYNELLTKLKLNIENKMTFNVIIANLMQFFNTINKQENKCDLDNFLIKYMFDSIIILLSPFAPHVTHYIWTFIFKKEKSILDQEFPKVIELKHNTKDLFKIMVCINGKFRKNVFLPDNSKEEDVINTTINDIDLAKYFINKNIKNIIYKNKKIINFLIE